ncbi:glycerol kinase [Thermanaerovibrio acidaminovorans DSM 6589]|uniref:Glycerol kinase n=1 Tax=Thermanaerovibrio acidaminovorans (strain ATCC 49978 / DSM 6589 / Su883) TaxID=525903 RepID=D1B6Y3_THEAS|nr:glycerol kinase GlpK [Thermanaerovibrio acidaminovorans]ACZ19774.1 glycerol kinase [Thermanaerovibrio acidaminovorans DSM 6589]
MSKKYVVAIDQGTTSTRCMVFDEKGLPVCSHQMEHVQIYPKPGWVEHDAMEIWSRTKDVIRGALEKGEIDPNEIASIGITNQRETTVVWEKATGKPIYNAIVWQCMRTQDFCAEWQKVPGWEQSRTGEGKVKDITGLLISPYFSGTKIKWILDNVPGARDRAAKGEILFGNIDTWLIWNLTGGPDGGVHVTDVSNASRTLLMDIKTLQWSEEMASFLDVPLAMMPKIMPSSCVYGHTRADGPFGAEIPVAGDLGDQQAALFGQACFGKGDTKNTYGTGCFMLMNIGETPSPSKNGLLTTAAYSLEEGKCVYALEGSIAITGAAVQWLRDNLRLFDEAPDSEYFASKVEDSGGIYFVPAFSGLYAPYWDMSARGAIVGLTRYIRKEHIVRATLESICYQTRDVVEAMNKDSGVSLAELKVDGGAVKNDLLMQMQADILGSKVVRPQVNETTALGAAYAAGLAVGFWKSTDELKEHWAEDRRFDPLMSKERREEAYAGWKKAISKAQNWID